MTHRAFIVIAGLALAGLGATPAMAQSNRTFVSGHGDDSNPCTVTFPCRSFAYAITQTNAGGEITTMDAAGYGLVTIDKAISITNDGAGEAGISVGSAVNGITINVGDSDVVNLRGLTLIGNGVGISGIAFIGSGTLNVINCTIRDNAQYGISVTPSFNGQVLIADTTTANNATAGVFATGDSGGGLTLSLSHVKIINNGFGSGGSGFKMTGGTAAYGFATIDNSLIAENGTGLQISASGSNTITAFVVNSNILNNAASVSVGAGSSIKLEKTAIATAFNGGITNNGVIKSFGDNAVLDTVTGNAITSVSFK
jgi:hypothetical protein